MKTAFFTIDDSPSIYMKEKVDILLKKDIPAVFFCQGNLMEKYPEQVIYAIKKGFIIGNHSYSHPKFSTINLESCKIEITKTDQIIDKLYEEAKIKRPFKYFRYPYGTKGDISYLSLMILFKRFDSKFLALESHLKELNYQPFYISNPKIRYPEFLRMKDTDFYWTIDLREWKMRNTNKHYNFSEVKKFVSNKLSYKNGNEIILVHDHKETHKYFDNILDLLISKNFKFKSFFE